MKTLVKILVFLAILFSSQNLYAQEHNHAPGHCPACEAFKTEGVGKPKIPTGELQTKPPPEPTESNNGILLLLLIGATTAVSAMAIRTRKKKQEA